MSKSKLVFLTSNTSWYLYNFRKSTVLALIEKGYQPVCLAPYDDYSNKLIELGAQFIPLEVEGKSTALLKEFFVALKILKLLKNVNPLFVFNFTIKMNIYVGLCCALLRIPFANNVSGLGTAFLHKSIIFSLAKKLYGLSNYFAKLVFFQNNEDLNLFIELGLVKEKKTRLLPGSGVNVEEFKYHRLSIETKPLTFLMIARIIADKGVKEYIEAADLVHKKHPNTRFLLVGDWNVSNKSAFNEQQIDTWQKNSIVEFLGHKDDVKPFIYESHTLVLPSYREGMPRTVLEAASCGRAAIVTDVPGCRQAIINNSTGWLCDVRSVESLASKMEIVLSLDQIELSEFGKRARENIIVNFSDEVVIEAYINAIK